MEQGNLFSRIPEHQTEEFFETIIETDSLRIERIVSSGQSTPEGEWCDQDMNEWVILLTGNAKLLFEDETEPIAMKPGDHILIPAHRRHRVCWTDPKQRTIWLAIHFWGSGGDKLPLVS